MVFAERTSGGLLSDIDRHFIFAKSVRFQNFSHTNHVCLLHVDDKTEAIHSTLEGKSIF